MIRRRALSLVLACCGACVPLIACGPRDGSSAGADAAGTPVVKTVKRGPVRVAVAVDPPEVAIAAPTHLRLTIDTEENVDVELPEVVSATLAPFEVRDVRRTPDVPTKTGRRWEMDIELTSLKLGTQTIPPLTIRFIDRRGEGEPIESELTTPELTVDVTSVLSGEFKPEEFEDIRAPMALARPTSWSWLYWAGGIGGVAGAIAAIVVLLMRRRKLVPARAIPAHELALDALRELQAAGLVERGEIHEFYFRLTTIVRQYIERRFGVMAAEQTTKEFLEAAKDHPALGRTYGELLRGFLVAGDMVKFARHLPGEKEIDQAFVSARDFVMRTAAIETPTPNTVDATERSGEAAA